MTYTEDFLRMLAKDTVMGEFYPFSTGRIKQVEKYVKSIVGRLSDIRAILVEADYTYYGSGFASYIEVRISKADKSDTQIFSKADLVTFNTNGIILYISNLVPYWYFGSSVWSVTTENGKWKGASSGFLRPESVEHVDWTIWGNEINRIKDIFENFNYKLLSNEDASQLANPKINVRTILSDAPYQVFDFFFHWMD